MTVPTTWLRLKRIKMKTFSLSFFILSLSLYGQSIPRIERDIFWRQGKKIYPIVHEKKSGELISKGCVELQEKCLAYKNLKKKSDVHLSEEERAGGKNPGAVVCSNKLNGEVLVLTDSAHNENSFCKFSDGSLLSVSALY